MNSLSGSFLIGEMLRNAKIIELHDLSNAMQVAAKTGLPVGRVLVMLGLVTNETVQAALQAQSMVRDHLINADTAMKAVSIVASYRIDLERALEHIGTTTIENPETNRLGELLLAAGLINNHQLQESLTSSQHLGLPLGRIFVLKNVLKESLVEAALNAQIMLRDGVIERSRVIDALRACGQKHLPLEASLRSLGAELPAKKQTVRIGELFILAELVREADLLTALEIGLNEQKQIGQVLLQFGFIDETVLDAGLKVQQMVQNQSVTVMQAVTILKLVASGQTTFTNAVAELAEPEVSPTQAFGLAHLLNLSGLVDQEDGEKSLAISYASKLPFDKVLVKYGFVTEAAMQVAVRCQLLCSEGLLTAEQAVVALHTWTWSQKSLTEVLNELGWLDEEGPIAIPLNVQPLNPPPLREARNIKVS